MESTAGSSNFRSGSVGNEGLCDHCTGVTRSGACAGRAKGTCCCTPNGLPFPSCVYYSPRILALLQGERTEFDTARDHWTVVDPEREAEAASIAEDNRNYFDEVLVKHPEWGAFFAKFEDLEVGVKIGEGAQAEIFTATSQSYTHPYFKDTVELVAKVWKEGVSLRDLEQQWSPQVLSKVAGVVGEYPFYNIYGGAFIRHGLLKNRFAFVMQRHWGDLRTLIDHRMLELFQKKSHGPPFDIDVIYWLLSSAAQDLHALHEAGIVHRDIKASNLLVQSTIEEDIMKKGICISSITDYECSIGVMGTTFWRAPEMLEQLQRRIRGSKLVFTEKADIYSFGMMCYEVVTGCIPFEGHPQYDYSIVLSGKRPELPHDLDLIVKEVIIDCWQQDPQCRPTSSNVNDRLYEMISPR